MQEANNKVDTSIADNKTNANNKVDTSRAKAAFKKLVKEIMRKVDIGRDPTLLRLEI